MVRSRVIRMPYVLEEWNSRSVFGNQAVLVSCVIDFCVRLRRQSYRHLVNLYDLDRLRRLRRLRHRNLCWPCWRTGGGATLSFEGRKRGSD